MIRCMICGKELKMLTSSGHLRKHGINKEQYLRRFPDAETVSDTIRETRSKIMRQKVKEGSHFVPFRDVKGLAKRILSKQDRNQIVFKGWETKRKNLGINNPKRSYKCIYCGKVKQCYPCEALYRKYCNSECFYRHRGDNLTSWGKYGYRSDLGHVVRSKWEANVCRIIKYLEGSYGYETMSLRIKDGNRTRVYILDLVDYDRVLSDGYIEVKGRITQRSKCKMELVEEQHPDFFKRLTIIYQKEMRELNKLYRSIIPYWETIL